ncbi:hypothetical protein SEVIR_2G373232v4 [Setaria viridis]
MWTRRAGRGGPPWWRRAGGGRRAPGAPSGRTGRWRRSGSGGGGGRGRRRGLTEHDPPARVEATVQASVRSKGVVLGAPPPLAAHGPEAHVVRNVVGERVLGDDAC